MDVPDSVEAPIRKGDKIGSVKLLLSGEEVGSVELIASENIEVSRLLVFWDQVKGVLGSFWFIFAVIFLILLILMYIANMVSATVNRRRYRNVRRRKPM